MCLKDIFSMLDSENDILTQQKGVELAAHTDNIVDFVLPMYPQYNKNVWENCARMIIMKTDLELAPYLVKILEWLQDLIIILNRLLNFDGEILEKAYVEVLNNAFNDPEENDEWLNHLSKLIENKELVQHLGKDVYSQVMVRYQNFWRQGWSCM